MIDSGVDLNKKTTLTDGTIIKSTIKCALSNSKFDFDKSEAIIQLVLKSGRYVVDIDDDFCYYLSYQKIQFETAEMFIKAGQVLKKDCFNAILQNKQLNLAEIRQWVKFLV